MRRVDHSESQSRSGWNASSLRLIAGHRAEPPRLCSSYSPAVALGTISGEVETVNGPSFFDDSPAEIGVRIPDPADRLNRFQTWLTWEPFREHTD